MTKMKEHHIMCAEDLVQHQSIRKTAACFGVVESTLRYRLERKRQQPVDGRSLQPEACAPYEEVISRWMSGQENLPPGKRPEPVKALYETLVSEYGYEGSYKAVVRYVRRRTEQPPLRPFRRVETAPGAQAQVDWLETVVNVRDFGGPTRLSAFLLTLSYSRMWAVVWSRREDMLSWLHCHNRALEMLGGVPSILRIDNLKTGVASGSGAWAKLNKGYSSYARQVGFTVDPHRVRTPRDKGKVERRVRDVKTLQVTASDRFADLDNIQGITWNRILHRSRRLLCPVTGKDIHTSWEREKQSLSPLPEELPEPFDVQFNRDVKRDCLVSFEERKYSVPYLWMNRTVEVRGCGGTVEIYGDGRKLCEFPRKTDCRLLVDQSHYNGGWDGGNGTTKAPVPLGRLGKQIVIPRSWEVEEPPRRSIERYVELVGAGR